MTALDTLPAVILEPLANATISTPLLNISFALPDPPLVSFTSYIKLFFYNDPRGTLQFVLEYGTALQEITLSINPNDICASFDFSFCSALGNTLTPGVR